MGKSLRIAICMPVGAQNVCPSTVQMISGLFFRHAIYTLLFGQSHLIPARNSTWKLAIDNGVDRILWCDSDVSAQADELIKWMAANEARFNANDKIGCVGAVVARRGGGWNFSLDETRVERLMLGMGLVYWNVPRVLQALTKAGRDLATPFRWVPPMSEDYEISSLLHRFGCWQEIGPELPTFHDGIGAWEGDDKPPGWKGQEKAIGKGARK